MEKQNEVIDTFLNDQGNNGERMRRLASNIDKAIEDEKL